MTIERAPARILGLAFAEDPLWSWILPDPAGRAERLTLVFDTLLRVRESCGDRVVSREGTAALWSPPGAPRDGLVETVRMLPGLLRGVGGGIGRLAQAAALFERERPSAPHGYLALLGTAPEARRRGTASGVVRELLEGCPLAWLETENPANVVFYERLGFEVRRTAILGPVTVRFMGRAGS